MATHADSDSPKVAFVQNKGQWESKILFVADIPSGRIFLERDRLTYAFCNTSDLHDKMFGTLPGQVADSMLDCHAYAVEFLGANPLPIVLGSDLDEAVYNYYLGNDPQKWAGDVPLYHSVRYQNLYPGIDFVIYAHDGALKYDFELAANANPNRIAMRYEGMNEIMLEEGALLVKTSLGTIQEPKPIAFQNSVEVVCDFSLEKGTVGFRFPNGYESGIPLTIDPTLIFSTYTGSFANNFGFTATYGLQGELYAGGIAYNQGYPVTLGVYQSNFAGAIDISISKFSPTGGHLYSTYLGGAQGDQPHSMVVDPFGNLLIFGRTQSVDYPVTAAAFDQTSNGSWDILVSKLNPIGNQLMASTYVGGDGPDGMNMDNNYSRNSIKYNYGDDARGEIITDDMGNVFVASCTQSGNFPTTFGAFQQQIASYQDGVVFRMNGALSQMDWCTHLGGSGNDAAYSLKVDGDGGVFVTGGTASSNFPTTPGTVTPNYQGGIDGFITHINNTGTGLNASTFIGTSSYNQCYFIELDDDEDVYVVGQKLGAFPITSGVYNTGNGGQFIQKLNYGLSNFIYSTVFGTSNTDINISPTAFLVDVCEYVYVSGWGGTTNFSGTTNGLPVTPGTIQSSTDGSDLYLIVLKTDAAALDFGTFMGGGVSHEHVDGGTSRFNKRAEVYQAVCAGCWTNSDFPTTPGALSNVNNSSCNLACFKMSLDLVGVSADFTPIPAAAGCAPRNIQFLNQSSGNSQSYSWNFDDPSSGAANTSTLMNPSHTFNSPGTYNVMLVAYDPNSCNVHDTTYRVIQVYPYPIATVTADTNVCEGGSITLQASGGSVYNWSPSNGLSSTTSASPTASPTNPQTYTVIVTNAGGCADTAQVTVGVLPLPTATASGSGFICPGDSLQLSASGGQSYAWSSPNTLSNPNIANPFAMPTQTTTYTVTVTAANGCTDQDTVSVQVSNVRAIPGPNVDLCIGQSTQLNGQGGGTYLWQPPLGLSGTTIANPVADPSNTTVYYLTVTDNLGCSHTDSLRVIVHPLPSIEVGPDLIMCEHDSIELNASGGVAYQWSPGTALSNPNASNPIASPTSSISYIVTGRDIYGCENYDTLAITVLPAPVANAWGSQRLCADSSIQVFASGGNSYLWSPSNVFNNPQLADPIATLNQSQILTVTVIASNGCDDTDTLMIPVTPTPVVDISGPSRICLGEFDFLLATGPGEFLWNTGETSPKIFVQPNQYTLYTVQTFVDGCPSKPDSVYITIDSILPIADFDVSPDSGLIPLTSYFSNMSQLSVEWDWDFGDGNSTSGFSPTHVYQDTGRFDVQLIATSANGCRDTAYHKVIVGADFTIYVPNAFTPNGDGLNDYWNTPWIGVKEFHVMLFDRWGMLIFESFDPDFQWPGALHGRECQEGVYTYVIEASGYLGEKVKKAGTVTLMR